MSFIRQAAAVMATVAFLGACGDGAETPAEAPIPTEFSFDGAGTSNVAVRNRVSSTAFELNLTLASAEQPPPPAEGPTYTDTYPPMPFTSAPLTAYAPNDAYRFRMMVRPPEGQPEPEPTYVFAGKVSAPTHVRLVNLPAGAVLVVDDNVAWSGPALAGLGDILLGKGYLERTWAGQISGFRICDVPADATPEAVASAPGGTFCAGS